MTMKEERMDPVSRVPESQSEMGTGTVEVLGFEWRARFADNVPGSLRPVGPQPRAYHTGIALAPKIPVILAQLTSLGAEDNFNRRKTSLDRLPYSLGGMCYSFFEFVRIQTELVDTLKIERGVFVPPSNKTDPLGYMLDMFLDHARKVANVALLYPYARYSIKYLPSGMGDLVKKHLEKRPDLLPGEQKLIISYWHNVGSKVKEYRDASQHHALLASDCRLFVGADGNPGAYFAIPNNPEVAGKKGGKLSYDPPKHAFLYMRRVFYETVKFVNCLCERLLDPAKPTNIASLGPNLRTPIAAHQAGVRIASLAMIDDELRARWPSLASSLPPKT